MPTLVTVPPTTAAKSHDTDPELLLMVAVWDQAKGAARSRKKRIEAERFLMVAPEVKFWVAVRSREKWDWRAWNPA